MQYLAAKLWQNFTFLTKVEPFRFVFIEVLHSLETRTPEEIEKQYVQVRITKRIASRTGALFLKNLNLVLGKMASFTTFVVLHRDPTTESLADGWI